MAMTRQSVTDDDGTGTTGTVLNLAFQTEERDNIDSAFIQTKEVTFTETTGAGTYTGSVSLPAGATLLDIVVTQVTQWTATTSATMKVGDASDDDGFFTGLNLKTISNSAGLSFFATANFQGASIIGWNSVNFRIDGRYSALSRTVSGIVTTVGAAGNAGRTRMTVIWSMPRSADVIAATKT